MLPNGLATSATPRVANDATVTDQLRDGGGDTLIEPGAVATELPTHITRSATKEGVGQLYSQIEVTADDIAEVIAFVIARPRRLAIHEVLLRPAGQEA